MATTTTITPQTLDEYLPLPLLTVQQVAQKLGISEVGVRQMARNGELKFVRVVKSLKFRQAHIIEYIDRQTGRDKA